jgi:chemotaxis response regulator CheB
VSQFTSSEEQSRVLRISIVEDDGEIRAHLAQLISRADGFSLVSEHWDAREAIEVVLREKPDVVLMDINLRE